MRLILLALAAFLLESCYTVSTTGSVVVNNTVIIIDPPPVPPPPVPYPAPIYTAPIYQPEPPTAVPARPRPVGTTRDPVPDNPADPAPARERLSEPNGNQSAVTLGRDSRPVQSPTDNPTSPATPARPRSR